MTRFKNSQKNSPQKNSLLDNFRNYLFYSSKKGPGKRTQLLLVSTGLIIFFFLLLPQLSGLTPKSIKSNWTLVGPSASLPTILPLPVLNYNTGTWNSDKYGNHRVVLRVEQAAPAIYAFIPWRRRDWQPEKKKIILVDATTGKEIVNLLRLDITREYGRILFEPQTIPGDYYLYYLPNVMTGRSNYPTVIYPEPDEKPAQEWLSRIGWPGKNWTEQFIKKFPSAHVLGIQSIDEFNSFFPMEVIATREEVESLLARHPDRPYFLFPEDRRYPIRMDSDLPYRWIKRGVVDVFRGRAQPGEFYAFQIGVYAAREAIADLEVSFSDFKRLGQPTATIPASQGVCFNTEGLDWKGRHFDKVCAVPQGKIQALWCGLALPEDLPPGVYRGQIKVIPRSEARTSGSSSSTTDESISSSQLPSTSFTLELEITGKPLKDHGDSQPWRHSRLRWLNSTIALDDEVVKPFMPVELAGLELRCLGRSLYLDPSCFPARIRSFFNPEVTGFTPEPRDILARPIQLLIENEAGRIIPLENKWRRLRQTGPGRIAWQSENEAGPLLIEVSGGFEFDGFAEYQVKLTARKDMRLQDIRLVVPFQAEVARYMMGLGQRGGVRPSRLEWHWDVKKNQDSVWLGDVNAGLQVSFYDENYQRPLNTNFYQLKPLILPRSWTNNGHGGIRLREKGREVVLTAFSGPHRLNKGEVLYYNFNLLITPFKTLDLKGHWQRRYYHRYDPVEKIKKTGANVINVHHATEINPFINYPFLRVQAMKDYIDQAHCLGMKVKIYYTVRELTNRAPELFALRSLGTEIFADGPGGGFSWLQEHLVDHYITGWFVPRLKDAAIINSGTSRWHNYYLEGLNWLAKNVGIDGLYIDDVAFDRTVMKRLRKILEKHRPQPLIDLHSANQFNPRDGFANSANLYLEHFPYLDRLWFGEYFDYGASPDYWLIEVSGIPFGLMGEMLQGGGNPYRGMIYGLTARLPWAGDPRAIWEVWDDFQIEKAEMYGYWSPNCPVRTTEPDILTTVYLKPGEALVALASWAKETKQVKLTIDWEKLGLSPNQAVIEAPAVANFQPAARFRPAERIPVEPAKGWLLIIKAKR
jgi:hypothetical protein